MTPVIANNDLTDLVLGEIRGDVDTQEIYRDTQLYMKYIEKNNMSQAGMSWATLESTFFLYNKG